MEPEEATVQDGKHELLVYRCDERIKPHPADYLGLAASIRESSTWTSSPESGSLFTCSHKETMTIRTMLCSTKLTQNGMNLIFQFKQFFFLSLKLFLD